MALQQEVWLKELVQPLFADNSFMSKAENDDQYVVENKIVHIPNSAAKLEVFEGKLKEKPVKATEWDDQDVTYDITVLRTQPVTVENPYAVELSYDKLQSVMAYSKEILYQKAAEYMLRQWFPASAENQIKTSGAAVSAHTLKAAGQRKAFNKRDVMAAARLFDSQDIPDTERYMLVDTWMYYQLLESLTASESLAFHKHVDIAKGVLGRLYNFDIMSRSTAGVYTSENVLQGKDVASAEGDLAAALAWHKKSLSRASGSEKMYHDEADPGYYGDVISFSKRIGGGKRRFDNKGLVAIIQDVVA